MKPDKALTQIAWETGLSLSYISRVFNGKRIPRLHYAKLLANSLGISLDELWEMLEEHYRSEFE